MVCFGGRGYERLIKAFEALGISSMSPERAGSRLEWPEGAEMGITDCLEDTREAGPLLPDPHLIPSPP